MNKKKIVVGVVGNPNCGKTTLFNALTGSKQTVGNWPGVTVEKKTGTMMLDGGPCDVVDLPGVYSLGAASRASEDERVARDYVLEGEADVIVNIVDASNLERNFYLTVQLLEMRVPVIVAVNMNDIAERRGIRVELDKLSEALRCPVVSLVATRKRGLNELKEAISRLAANPKASPVEPDFGAVVEGAIADLQSALAALPSRPPAPVRWLALKLIEGDESVRGLEAALPPRMVETLLARIEEEAGEEADILIADARFSLVGEVVKAAVTRPRQASRTLSDNIDRVVLNRVLGIPVFLAMMYLMFLFTINVGGSFIDFFDKAGDALFVDGVSRLLVAAHAPEWVVVVLAKGLGGGIKTVGTFIPVIGFLFLFLSFLEDSGYMARAAFVMDRAMRAIGLPGKSFVPLIVGFGCNVAAVMATRTLDHRRDRVLTVMMAPFMSCGARLPVYALFAAAFFPGGGQNLVFSLYLVGLAFAVGTGLLLKNTLLKGEASPFVMELPPYHLPTPGTVARRAGQRLNDFVFRAGKVIVPMVMVLSFLSALGPDGSFGHEDSSESMLAKAAHAVVPVFEPMGMTENNWPAAVGIVTGVFAKEAVVGTLNALYAEAARGEEPAAGEAAPAEAPAPPGIGEKLAEAFATIPENLLGLVEKAGDPLGPPAAATASAETGVGDVKAGSPVFGTIAERFASVSAAYAYMLLILLYTPCVAAAGAIAREAGGRWMLFAAAWTTGLGYSASVIFYQASIFERQPGTSAVWIAACLAAVATAGLVMRAAAPDRRGSVAGASA